MVATNGGLTEHYGLYMATFIIHFTGLFFITILVFINKDKILHKRQPWHLYLGGFIGVVIILFTVAVFSRISVSAILALGLLGQCIAGIFVDHYGLMRMPKIPFARRKWIGITIIILGIAPMINSFDLLAVVLAFLAGVAVLIARTINANLAEVTSVQTSTFYNYAFGSIGAVIVLLLLGRGDISNYSFDLSFTMNNWYLYIGGLLGLIMVSICNFAVKKVSAFYFTLLLFIGQIFMGIIVDVILTGELVILNLVGGILVTIGLCVDLILDKRSMMAANKVKS
jgi:transporter family-2 protein